MNVFSKLRVLLICLLIVSVQDLDACDFDNDGIDDPTAYEQTEEGDWNWKSLLSGGGEKAIAGFGTQEGFTAPASWLGASQPAVYGYIDEQFFWTAENGDRLNFGRTNISYYPGHDFNGDGVADLLKFENRCNKFSKTCYKTKARGNFAFNVSDGVNTFIIPVDTATALFGGGMDPHVVADVNQDGVDDICYAKPRKRNPKVFTLTCMNLAREKLWKLKLGRLFNPPFALQVAGNADSIVLYRSKKKKGTTTFTVYSPDGSKPREFVLNAVGSPIVGDWAGTGSQQLGVVADSEIVYVNPVDESIGSVSRPPGTVIDCYNNFQGPGEKKVFNSKNVCKAYNCKRK